MPKFPDPQLWPVLAAHHSRQQTLREWQSVLGCAPLQSVPLLRVQGERAEFIRCPQTGIPLEIHENWDGSFSALPPVDSQLDSRIDGLTLADLLLYELDWQTILEKVQTQWALSGNIRFLSYKPPMWHLGESSGIPCCFAVLTIPSDVDEILPFIQSSPQSRLLIPTASDKIFSALSRAGIQFQVLNSPLASSFPSPGKKLVPRFRIYELDYEPLVYEKLIY